ncbi:hypothetical protein [Streptomyces botrytidirepellens]|uniref:hypothetical protein n=1 Tax=Streptomyces botrytidirepellens TaxID=2486417 RepID=UPI0011CE94E4|nr:hypothetical protein [Streptomyces botrytidirepellens]
MLEPHTVGAILGGSMAFTPYYGVRGSTFIGAASDIDLLIAIPNASALPRALKALAPFEALDQLPSNIQSRCDYFSNESTRHPVVFSQKIGAWTQARDPDFEADCIRGYNVSLNFIEYDNLAPLLLPPTLADGELRVPYYRDRPGQDRKYKREDLAVSFSGEVLAEERIYRTVTGGFVESSLIWKTAYGRLYIGRLWNTILPTATVAWGEASMNPLMYLFLESIKLRLEAERKMRPHEYQALRLSHSRSGDFAPSIAAIV